jgi:predicted porin
MNNFGKWLAASILASLASSASAVDTNVGEVSVRLDLQVDIQGASFDTGTTGSDTASNLDWSVRLRLEQVLENGWLLGIRAEVDQDFDAESDANPAADDVELDEIYAYVSTPLGRVEVGEQDGPADTFALHAPTIGTGQIRGDFSRYAGTGARLKPFDSQDAFKIIYLSPPIGGLRFGASWGPELEVNANDPVPTRRTIQKNPVEFAAQYQTPIGEALVLAISGAYVTANSDPITGREDIDSWSIGSELRWKQMRFGGAYVVRGDSNAALGRDEEEFNVGASWRKNKWALAGSYAHITRTGSRRDLFGIGGSFDIGKNLVLRSDLVVFDETFVSGFTRNGTVALVDLRIRY